MSIPAKDIPREPEIDRELCLRSFYYFLQTFWHAVIQEKPVYNWHIKYLCERLQHHAENVFERRPAEADILINVPPGSSKSTIASVMFPAWLWIKDASLRVMNASYAQTLSFSLSEKSRDIMRDEYFQFLFPEVQIRQDIDSKSRYQNTAGGERRATSVGGSVTGFHAHVIIVDDPLNPNEAISEKDRDKANRFMTDTLPTRKVDKLVSLTVLIMQRLHENDPAGQMLKNEDLVVEHICLPGYESPNINPPELVEYYVDRQLDPIRLSHAAMKKLKAAMGSYNYAGQIGQEPSPADGEIWKRSWFKIMPRAKILEAYKCINHGHDWDLAYTEDTKNSASAYVHGCKADHFAAVLDCGFAYLEFPPLIQYMKSKSERAHYIEAKASGKSAKQTLVRQGIPAVEITVAGGSDKMARTRFATPFAEAGMVIVAQEVADLFLDDPQQGLLKFPKTGTDLNDAFVQFLNRVLGKRPTRIKKRRTV